MQGYKICEDLTTHPSRKRVPAWGIPEKSTYIDFGNREVAQFRPPREVLAFPIREPVERDLPEIWTEPLPAITNNLKIRGCNSCI